MSGISGIYDRGGSPVRPEELDDMLGTLKHRGGDDQGCWCGGCVGLGHQMVRTTPESSHEDLPLVRSGGSLVLTADARIDNRKELLRKLGNLPAGQAPITDSELVLSAYQKWGIACPEELLGAFAFAIWDERQRRLFCARDHVGVRPLYYLLKGQTRFVFASEIKSILEGTNTSADLNDTRVADYLAGIVTDSAYTFYEGIHRLPPGHRMVVTRQGITIEEYWSVDSNAKLDYRSEREYVNAFRDIFSEAVRCRIRSSVPLGFALSGGLDSSSVTCMAARLSSEESGERSALNTYSVAFDRFKECDERKYINSIVRAHETTPRYVRGDSGDISLEKGMERLLEYHDEPYVAPNAIQSLQLYGLVRQHGTGVLLHGHGGDETVSNGRGYLKELAADRRWWRLTSEIAAGHGTDWSAFAELWTGYVRYGLEQQSPARLIPRMLTRASLRVARLMYRYMTDQGPAAHRSANIISDRIRRQTDLDRRYEEWRRGRPARADTERERHRRLVASEYRSIAFEELDRVSAAFGVDTRFPLWDKRVVEFCLALPSDQKFSRGVGRTVLREAMAGMVPDKVRMRRDKADFSPNLRELVQRSNAIEKLDQLAHKNGLLNKYVRPRGIREISGLLDSGDASMQLVFQALRLLTLAKWIANEKLQ